MFYELILLLINFKNLTSIQKYRPESPAPVLKSITIKANRFIKGGIHQPIIWKMFKYALKCGLKNQLTASTVFNVYASKQNSQCVQLLLRAVLYSAAFQRMLVVCKSFNNVIQLKLSGCNSRLHGRFTASDIKDMRFFTDIRLNHNISPL